ncbi:2-(1,2-epoxy-1,2-dihydrophenyl)acetyl-CoA isomerase [archaeon 13_1_40CM_4_53_4]|nr:MAG: 2-(1,2-epoxy-1,2-dihydrophenyl)acetyl-CoA isomerase [archaeon 13_1_40CM_4_53_4]
MGYETIIVEKKDQIARITLNRPQALNALNEKMGEELNAALKEVERDPETRCLVITGAGRAFSAGEDVSGLKERYAGGAHPSLGDHLRKKYHPIILRIRNMEKPIIARINGIAAGSGASIALACDIRIASEEAGLKQAFIGVGLVPDSGSSYFLTQNLGPGRALELIMTGRTVGAKEAETLGLVNKTVPAAEKLANGPTRALGLSKRVVNQAARLELSEALEYEAQNQQIAGRTKDHLEAVRAFLEKRQPKFSGN